MPTESLPYGQIPVTQYGGVPNFGQSVIRPQAGQAIPRNGRGVPTQPGATQWGVGLSSYGPDNNLIGTQIGPGESAGTQRATQNATGAQQALTNFQFTPYSGAAPADYTQAQNLLTGANSTYGAAQLNYGAGNAARTQATAALGAGRAQASPYLTNAGSLGLTAYTGGAGSGGAAARADTGDLNASLRNADTYVGSQYADAGDTQRARALTAQALEKSMSAPDRGAIAAETLALLEERSRPGFELETRGVNQRAAAMGRRGSGLVNSELADLSTARERELALARRDVANDAASRTLDDRAALTRLGLDVTGTFGGEDRAGVATRLAQSGTLANNANSRFAGEALNAQLQDSAYGRMEQAAGRNAAGAQAYAANQRAVGNDFYGMANNESQLYERNAGAYDTQENNRVGLIGNQATFQRDVGNDLAGIATTNYGQRAEQAQRARADEYNQFGAARDRASDLTGYQNDERTYDANNRNELRTERTYQNQQQRNAIDDEVRRVQLEDQLRNSAFDRSYRTTALGLGAPTPGTVYGNQADRYAQQAQQWGQAAGDSAELIGYNGRRSGAGRGAVTQYDQYGYPI